jgi:hypothetical protein
VKMAISVLFLLLSFNVSFPALQASDGSYSLSKLRALYPKASAKEEIGRQFYARMASYQGNNPVVLGYQAVSEAVMAKHVWSPYQKLKHVRNSGTIFRDALNKDPQNPEVRFLRFTVEYSIPRYLKMSENLAADREFVAQQLLRHPNSGIDQEGYILMRNFMLNGNHLTPAERGLLSRK